MTTPGSVKAVLCVSVILFWEGYTEKFLQSITSVLLWEVSMWSNLKSVSFFPTYCIKGQTITLSPWHILGILVPPSPPWWNYWHIFLRSMFVDIYYWERSLPSPLCKSNRQSDRPPQALSTQYVHSASTELPALCWRAGSWLLVSMLQVLDLISLPQMSSCKNARKAQIACPIVMILDLASSFSLACFCNWNGRPSQMTPLISEYYFTPATAFFCLHTFWRTENNKRELSVCRVGLSINKSSLRTSEFIKTVSHLWKLANCSEPQFFLILSFQNPLLVQVLQCLQDDSTKNVHDQDLVNMLIINADVLKTMNFFKINASEGQF